jgi:hypothetical protein
MASEILTIPEESIPEVIAIIRCGLQYQPIFSNQIISGETIDQLTRWCDDMEKYYNDTPV